MPLLVGIESILVSGAALVKEVLNRYYAAMSDTFLDLVERIGNLLRHSQRSAVAAENLQPVHWQVLGYLARCNRYSNTPTAITAYLGTTKGTASQSLKVLGRAGLVEARDDPQDRRVVRLQLTPAGETLAAEASAMATWDTACACLAPAERDAARAVLEKLLRALQVHNGLRSFGECHSCRHFTRIAATQFQCGLTGEALSAEDAGRICHEHEFDAPAGAA